MVSYEDELCPGEGDNVMAAAATFWPSCSAAANANNTQLTHFHCSFPRQTVSLNESSWTGPVGQVL